MKLTEHNRIQLVWAPGQIWIDGNKIAYQLGRQSSVFSLWYLQ